MMDDSGRRVIKPDVITNDDDVGLLDHDETMTNSEFLSVFYNTKVFNEDSGEMVFDTETINKFKRFMYFQSKLTPLREQLVYLQLEKYFVSSDVNKENYKLVTLSLFGEKKLNDVKVYASKKEGEYFYVELKIFKKMLKLVGDNIAQFLSNSEEAQFASLKFWAFDNDLDITDNSDNKMLEITFYTGENESGQNDEENEETEEKSTNKRSTKKRGDTKEKKNSNAITEDQYNAIFNVDYIESGEDVQIRPSVIKNLEKLINDMEAIKPVRAKFALHNINKFIEGDIENLDINVTDNVLVKVNSRIVGKMKFYKFSEDGDIYIDLYSFKLILMRLGAYYAIYINTEGEETILVNLSKWNEECCGEMEISENAVQIIF